jgi:hypothetical protein
MSAFSGQIFLVGTVVCGGVVARVARGARCPMISVVDCDRLKAMGQMDQWETEDGLNAGALLDATLGRHGWTDIAVRACLPVEGAFEAFEPELQALVRTAATIGWAHMVFEPACEAPTVLH